MRIASCISRGMDGGTQHSLLSERRVSAGPISAHAATHFMFWGKHMHVHMPHNPKLLVLSITSCIFGHCKRVAHPRHPGDTSYTIVCARTAASGLGAPCRGCLALDFNCT